MESFTQNFILIEGLTITFSLFAITISFFAFIFSKKNAKRQIRVGKLEEILESILTIVDSYSSLKSIFDLEQKIRNPKIQQTGLETISWQSEKEKLVIGCQQGSNVNKFREKLTRLVVLANSYLDRVSKNRYWKKINCFYNRIL